MTLTDQYSDLQVQKMKLDKYFSEFLEENEKEMNESINFDSPAWITYRKKLKEYDEVDKFIARTRYHLNKKCLKIQNNFLCIEMRLLNLPEIH